MDTIINTYDQLKAYGGDRVAISYQTRGDAWSLSVPGWHVWRMLNGKTVETDKEAAYYHGGMRFFSLLGCGKGPQARKVALERAIAWANKQFGKRDFTRNRMGSYVERQVNEKYPIRKRERKRHA